MLLLLLSDVVVGRRPLPLLRLLLRLLRLLRLLLRLLMLP